MKTLLRGTAACRRIGQDASGGNAAHAMLVLFPDERLLRALLKECAKAFFGAAEGGRTAKLIDEECYADCMLVPAAGEKLSAERVSDIIEESLLAPVEGDRKLFVLDAFHTAAGLVQNKLLKLLEEPPQGVYFLLGATSEHAVLPTVLSRTKRFEIPPFTEEEILGALERGHVRGEGLREAAAASGGLLSVAEDLVQGGGEEFRLAEEFLSLREVGAVCRTIGERKDRRAFFSALKLVLSDLLFLSAGRERDCKRCTQAMKGLAEEYPAGVLLAALSETDRAEREVAFNANGGQAALALALRIWEEQKRWQKLS